MSEGNSFIIMDKVDTLVDPPIFVEERKARRIPWSILPVTIVIARLLRVSLMHRHTRVVSLSGHRLHHLVLIRVRVVHRIRLTLWDHVRLARLLAAAQLPRVLEDSGFVARGRSDLDLATGPRRCKVTRRDGLRGVAQGRVPTIRRRSEGAKRISAREVRVLFARVSSSEIRSSAWMLVPKVRLRGERSVRIVAWRCGRVGSHKDDGLTGGNLEE